MTNLLTISIVISSLELASKNIVCGSVKMVYALIYTLFLVCVLFHAGPVLDLKLMRSGFWSPNWLRLLLVAGPTFSGSA